jgi:hypothetical protein
MNNILIIGAGGDQVLSRVQFKNSWFEHIAITAGTPELLEPVNDQWYVALHV